MSALERLMVFCRVPGVDRVKTRLAAALGSVQARTIYEACLLDTLDEVYAPGMPETTLCVSPPGALSAMSKWLAANWQPTGALSEHESAPLWPQDGEGLGVRMAAAFGRAFREGCHAAVLIGSDAPGLGRRQLRAGFEALTAADLVFGPALDGGFYLVGARRDAFPAGVKPMFDEVVWSQSDTLIQVLVRARTIHALTQKPLRIHLLEAWPDLDTAADIPNAISFIRTHRAAGEVIAPRLLPLLEKVHSASGDW